MDWIKLYHLGDLALTIPAAGAIAAWLCAARAWRAAAGWLLAFGLALALVAGSKIAFMGWDTGLPALGYKAMSGHAAGFAATFPTLCRLLFQGRPGRRGPQGLAVAAALTMSAVVAAALVRAGEHTPAEAAAGWLVGASAFACTLRLARGAAPASWRSAGAALLVFGLGAGAWTVAPAPLNRWMVRVALALSGNPSPYPWDICG
jgi:hypothetical protein